MEEVETLLTNFNTAGKWALECSEESPTHSAFMHNKELLSNIYSRVSSAWCWGEGCRKARGKLKPGATRLCFHLWAPPPRDAPYAGRLRLLPRIPWARKSVPKAGPLAAWFMRWQEEKRTICYPRGRRNACRPELIGEGDPETQETALSTKMVQIHSRKCHIQTATCERLKKPFTPLWF